MTGREEKGKELEADRCVEKRKRQRGGKERNSERSKVKRERGPETDRTGEEKGKRGRDFKLRRVGNKREEEERGKTDRRHTGGGEEKMDREKRGGGFAVKTPTETNAEPGVSAWFVSASCWSRGPDNSICGATDWPPASPPRS